MAPSAPLAEAVETVSLFKKLREPRPLPQNALLRYLLQRAQRSRPTGRRPLTGREGLIPCVLPGDGTRTKILRFPLWICRQLLGKCRGCPNTSVSGTSLRQRIRLRSRPCFLIFGFARPAPARAASLVEVKALSSSSSELIATCSLCIPRRLSWRPRAALSRLRSCFRGAGPNPRVIGHQCLIFSFFQCACNFRVRRIIAAPSRSSSAAPVHWPMRTLIGARPKESFLPFSCSSRCAALSAVAGWRSRHYWFVNSS